MKTFKEYLTPVAILILAAVLLYDRVGPRPGPSPAPSINGAALGKTYAPVLASSYADAWLAAAKSVEEGKTIAEAQKVLQDTWKETRTRAFTAEVAPGFSVVLPEGTEPTTPDKRAQVAELWKSFSRGLKGGH